MRIAYTEFVLNLSLEKKERKKRFVKENLIIDEEKEKERDREKRIMAVDRWSRDRFYFDRYNDSLFPTEKFENKSSKRYKFNVYKFILTLAFIRQSFNLGF